MEIRGFDELLHAMQESELTLVSRRRLIVKSLRAGGKVIEAEAKANAPVLTGELHSKISTSVIGQTAEGAEAHVGPTNKAYYGIFSEYGTSRQPETPWLGPSFDRKEQEAVETVAQVLGDGLEEAFYG